MLFATPMTKGASVSPNDSACDSIIFCNRREHVTRLDQILFLPSNLLSLHGTSLQYNRRNPSRQFQFLSDGRVT
jgi:hypothetical protein